ncbi:MAG TPA: hypothetical protein VJR02_18120 [Pyrinomonadaceae bacterium]|nr:hypothetical protein [Pyrinomonadaceae bacterium]
MNKNFAPVDSNFDLREAADLIRRAKLDKQTILRSIEAQRGTQQRLDQQREDVSLLPDREAERIQAEWVKDAKASALRYCDSRNAGATPKAFNPANQEEVDLRNGVLGWLAKQRAKRSLYKKN